MNIMVEKCCKCMENLFYVVIFINLLIFESDWFFIFFDGIIFELSIKVMRIKERINKVFC